MHKIVSRARFRIPLQLSPCHMSASLFNATTQILTPKIRDCARLLVPRRTIAQTRELGVGALQSQVVVNGPELVDPRPFTSEEFP